MKDCKCPYCNKFFSKYGIKNHIAIVHDKIDGRIPDRTGAIITNETIQKLSTASTNKWKNAEYRNSVISSLNNNGNCSGIANTIEAENERKRKLSVTMKGNTNWENSINVSGRGKKGKYQNYFFASTWELAYIIYNLDNGIQFERNWKKFEYEYEDKKHQYIPDFVLPDGSYVEVKGYHSKQFDAKQLYFTEKLFVIDKTNIGMYLDYAIDKFGKDFYVSVLNIGLGASLQN